MFSPTDGEKNRGFLGCHNSLVAVYKSDWNVHGQAGKTLRKL